MRCRRKSLNNAVHHGGIKDLDPVADVVFAERHAEIRCASAFQHTPHLANGCQMPGTAAVRSSGLSADAFRVIHLIIKSNVLDDGETHQVIKRLVPKNGVTEISVDVRNAILPEA